MKLGMILSLLANIALVLSLGLQARNTNKKIDENTLNDMAECAKAVKTVATIGYLGGCMTATSEARHIEQGDPLIPLFMDYCMQGAKAMAEKIELKP
jgi:hypothetical protein